MKMARKICFCITAFLLLVASLFAGCANEVPKPKVKEGRFYFSVTYEVNGEEQTVSGVYVCKFVKATASLNGWWREWNTYIEGGELEEEFEVLTNEDGRITLDFCFDAFYFMSDPFYDAPEPPKPEFTIYYNETKRAETGIYWTCNTETLEGYGVKIISYEYDQPIENIYE